MERNQEYRVGNGIPMLLCARVVNSDISEDFTLPDYCPEIRRVLYLKEELPLPARFMGGTKIDVNGVIDYTLVYVNGEGEVCSAPLSSEYSFSLPVENANELDLSEAVTLTVHTVAENSSVRVSSPRRLQIRSHLCSNVFAYGRMLCTESCEGLEDESSIERLEGESMCAQITCESSDVITLNDRYALSGESDRIALADSEVLVKSSRISGDCIFVSGEANVKMLVLRGVENEEVTRRLPFEAQIDISGIEPTENISVRVDAFVTDTAIELEEGGVEIELSFVLEACICRNIPVAYTKDVYSTQQTLDISSKRYSLHTVVANKCFSKAQSERLVASEINFPEGAQIVHIYGSGIFENACADEDGDSQVIKGICKYNLICLVGGEYTHVEARVPFCIEVDIDTEMQVLDAVVTLSGCKAACDEESLELSSDITVSCMVLGSTELEIPREIRFGERRAERNGSWTVCYVGDGEDAWSIAKRYGVCSRSIIGDPQSDRFVVIEK